MQTFIQIIEKIKKIKGITLDYEVADLLNISKKAFAADKKRDSLPFEELSAFCRTENISINWLLYNEGPMTIGKEYPQSLADPPRFSVAEIPPVYEQRQNGIDPYLQAIADVKEIFDSEDPILIPAIQANLHAFKRAVKREQQFSQILKENEDLRSRMSSLEANLKSISSQFENLQAERKVLKTENNRLKSTYENPNGDDGNITNTSSNGTET